MATAIIRVPGNLLHRLLGFLRMYVLGGEIVEHTELHRQARNSAIDRLQAQAEALGADAVVDLEIETVADLIGKNAEINAYGTAVRLSKR